MEGLVHYISDGDHGDDGTEILAQMRVVLGIKLLDRLALVAGVTLNALAAYDDDSEYGHFGVDLGESDDWEFGAYPGLMVGVQIL